MRDTESPTLRRREIVTKAGTVAISAPAFVSVASAQTDSGNVEVQTTATVPSSTSIEITVHEDLNANGTADNQQTETVPDGTATLEFDALDGYEAQGYQYWLEVSLSTTDDSTTPSLDSATVTLPEEESTPTPTPVPETGPQGIDAIWDNYLFYVTSLVISVAGIGLASKSLAVAAFAGYLTFAYVALETGTPLLENILYVTLVLVFIGFAFKFWRLEGMGE